MEITATITHIQELSKFDYFINECAACGIRSFRVNFSKNHDISALADTVTRVVSLCGRADCKFIFDLPYPSRKPRLSLSACHSLMIQTGKHYMVSCNRETKNHGADHILIDTDISALYENMGNIIYYSDGDGAFKVHRAADSNMIELIALNNFQLISGKSLYLNKLISDDKIPNDIIDFIAYLRPQSLAFSFIENTSQINNLKAQLKDTEYEFISKIETETAIQNIESVIENSDSIMIGRGDLGLSIPLPMLSCTQETIIDSVNGNSGHKKCYVATGILSSLIQKYIPSRSEITDLYHIIHKKPFGIVLNNLMENYRQGMMLQIADLVMNMEKICEELK